MTTLAQWSRRAKTASTAPRPSRSGQVAVESALIMIVFLYMVMGVADFAWAFFLQNTVANAVREGARKAAVRQCRDTATSPPTVTTSIDWAVSQGLPSLPYDSANLTVTYSGGTPTPGSQVTVAYSFPYQPFTPLVGDIIRGVLGANPTLSAQASVTVEGVNSAC